MGSNSSFPFWEDIPGIQADPVQSAGSYARVTGGLGN